MNKKKIIIVIAVVILLGVALYLIFKKPKPVNETTAQTDQATKEPISFPLKLGSKGAGVLAVQKYLNLKYNAVLKEDGIWGALTDTAVRRYLLRDNVSETAYKNWNLD